MKQRCTSRLCMRDCMCEGRGSNRILNEFVIQMRRGLCPNYNIDSDVVQLNIKKKYYGAKTSQYQKVSAPNRLGAKRSARKRLSAKRSWRQKFPAPRLPTAKTSAPKRRRQNVGAKTSAPKRHSPHIQILNGFHLNNIKNKKQKFRSR